MTNIPDPAPRLCEECDRYIPYREERKHEAYHCMNDERLRGAPHGAVTLSFYFRWVKYLPEDRHDEFRREVGELATAYYQRGEIGVEIRKLLGTGEATGDA